MINLDAVVFTQSQGRFTAFAAALDGDRRYAFSGLNTTMHCEPYSEPSPYIEVSFTVAK
jgi:hypothetical protein